MAMSDEKKFRIYLCGGPTCTPKGRDALLRTLEDELFWPGPYHYSALTPAAIKQIVEQHLLNGQLVREYLLGEEARR